MLLLGASVLLATPVVATTTTPRARVEAAWSGLQQYFYATQTSAFGVNATFWKSCGQTGGLGGATSSFDCKCEANSAYCKNCVRWWMAVAMQSLISYHDASTSAAANPIAPNLTATSTPTEAATKALLASLRVHSPYTSAAAPTWAYIDDYLWYVNMWLDSYDWLGDADDLESAAATLELMDQWGLDLRCGGIQWMYPDVDPRKNAITTLEAVQGSARVALALRQRGHDARAATHEKHALALWGFFDSVGLRGDDDLIHDNVTGTPHGKFHCCNATAAPRCEVRDTLTWSYNQGMYLGALVDLHRLTNHTSYLSRGAAVLAATIATLTRDGGEGRRVLREPVEAFAISDPTCDATHDPSAPAGGDLFSFKGVFMVQLPRFIRAVESAAGGAGELAARVAADARQLVADSADAAWASRALPPFPAGDICNEFPDAPAGGPPKFTWDWAPVPTAASGTSDAKALVCMDARTQAQALSLFVADYLLQQGGAPEATAVGKEEAAGAIGK